MQFFMRLCTTLRLVHIPRIVYVEVFSVEEWVKDKTMLAS